MLTAAAENDEQLFHFSHPLPEFAMNILLS